MNKLNDIERLLKEAELKRIQTETLKLEEEKLRVEIERRHLEQDFGRPWYKKGKFYQTVAAGIFAFPILWFFFSQIIRPAFEKDNIKLALENQRAEAKNERVQAENKRVKAENDSVKAYLEERELRVFSLEDSLLESKHTIDEKSVELQEKEKRLQQEAGKNRLLNEDLLHKELDLTAKQAELDSATLELIRAWDVNDEAREENIILEQKIRKLADTIIVGCERRMDDIKGDTVWIWLHQTYADLIAEQQFWSSGQGILRIENNLLLGQGVRFVEVKTSGRELNPSMIIVHGSNAHNVESIVKFYTSRQSVAVVHLVIGRDGEIVQLVPFNVMAAHAKGYNTKAIGIQLDNAGQLSKFGDKYKSWFGRAYDQSEVVSVSYRGEDIYWHKYTKTQIALLKQITSLLIHEYNTTEIVGHDEINPDKRDPGPSLHLEKIRDELL